MAIVAQTPDQNWNGQENNARSSTNLERQGNEQGPENKISSLAGVDSSHLYGAEGCMDSNES